jgi:hypothetical protein
MTREEVYTFAHGCIEHGEVEAAAVAVICFEWLQRPENVIAGHIKWSGYRTGPKPTIRIEHHKTGEIVDHPLEDGEVKFYEEAEEVLSHLKRLGTPMILYEVANGKAKPFAFSTMQHKVQRMRVKLGLQALHVRCLPARRHDGTGGSGTDRWTGPRAVSAPDAAELHRLRQAHRKARARGHPQAARTQAGERNGDRRSE